MIKRSTGLAVAATLLLAGTADAKSTEYLGSFKGQPEARIGIFVKTDSKGVPKKVSLISYGGGSLKLPCSNPAGVSFPADPTSYQDLKLKKAGKSFSFAAEGEESAVNTRSIEGKIAGSGKKVTGTIDHEMDFGGSVCAVNDLRFVAKRKKD